MIPDHAVREIIISRPRLRRDLRFSFQDYRETPSYVLEDLTHRRYFQIGLAEHQFLSELNGIRTAREVLADNARIFGEDAISEEQAVVLLRWAIDQQLLETESADQSGRRYQHTHEQLEAKPKKLLQKLMFLRIPLGNPDPFLTAITPWVKWLASPAFVLIWLVVVGYGGFLMAENFSAFMNASASVLIPGTSWLLLGAIFVILKIVHEIGHGVLAKKYGGNVPEFGVTLIVLLAPLTYVDATSSWRFESRWQRIFVAFGGMYVELFLAAAAMVVWVNTGPGLVNTAAHNVAFAASVVTLLFNANPLMRFDGYFILSDLLRLPNLGTRGQQFVQWLVRKTFFSVKNLPLPPSFADAPWSSGIYGVLAFFWRVVIWLGIMLILGSLFAGAGVVLVAIAVVGMIATAVYKTFHYLFTGAGGPRPHLVFSVMKLALIIGGVVAAGLLIPVTPTPKAAAVIEYPDKAILRAESPGFVSEILCEHGAEVTEGQVLMKLENLERVAEHERLKLNIQQSELRRRQYFQNEQLAAFQAETENLRSLRERFEISQELVDSLTVKAPVAGVVYREHLDSLVGQFLSAGSTIVTIIPDGDPHILISLSQEHVNETTWNEGEPILLRLRGRNETVKGTLARVEQKSTTAVPHAVLASTSGGPLLVRQRANISSTRDQGLAFSQGGDGEVTHFIGLGQDVGIAVSIELTRQRFAAYAELDAEAAEGLRGGEWGFAKLVNSPEVKLGEWLGDKVELYIRAQFEKMVGE